MSINTATKTMAKKANNYVANKVKAVKKAATTLKKANHTYGAAAGSISGNPIKAKECVELLNTLSVHTQTKKIKAADFFTAANGRLVDKDGKILMTNTKSKTIFINDEEYTLCDAEHKAIKVSKIVRLMSEDDSTYDKKTDLYVTADRVIDMLKQHTLIDHTLAEHATTNANADAAMVGICYIDMRANKDEAAKWTKVLMSTDMNSWYVEGTKEYDAIYNTIIAPAEKVAEKKVTKRTGRKSAKKAA